VRLAGSAVRGQRAANFLSAIMAADTLLSLQQLARALGGDISNGWHLVPATAPLIAHWQ
jgi:hypothetical protein